MDTPPHRAPRPSLPSVLVRPVALLALVLVATGCPSFATRGSARTLKAGEWEVEAGLGAVAANPLAGPSRNGYDGEFDTEDFNESTGGTSIPCWAWAWGLASPMGSSWEAG